MARITLTNKSQLSTTHGELTDGKLLFPRSIYQRLGSLTHCMRIVEDYENDRLPIEFKKFLDDMNEVNKIIGVPTESIKAIDEYLGDLGDLEEYPYSKDSREIPQWLISVTENEYRILTDASDNTYLTDGTDDTVLVYIN